MRNEGQQKPWVETDLEVPEETDREEEMSRKRGKKAAELPPMTFGIQSTPVELNMAPGMSSGKIHMGFSDTCTNFDCDKFKPKLFLGIF